MGNTVGHYLRIHTLIHKQTNGKEIQNQKAYSITGYFQYKSSIQLMNDLHEIP
jgi:hypothetical protein